jgi:hypothetical protein
MDFSCHWMVGFPRRAMRTSHPLEILPTVEKNRGKSIKTRSFQCKKGEPCEKRTRRLVDFWIRRYKTIQYV